MSDNAQKASHYVPRHAESLLREALTESRIVAIVGPRQSGKSTLAGRIARQDGRRLLTLDDVHARQFAVTDPHGFVRENQFAAIDEIQLAPDLVFALKKDVDENPRPGPWLITGSVDLFKKAVAPDSLAGRVRTIKLLPFSQAESAGRAAPTFLQRAFAADFPSNLQLGHTQDIVERVLTGGYPPAFFRKDMRSKQNWLREYADSLAEHDLPGLATAKSGATLPRLLNYSAAVIGQTTNLSALAGHLAVDYKTVDRWLTLLERMFIIRRVAPWGNNRIKRLSKTPKLYFIDSGLAAALRAVDQGTIAKRRDELGPLLENFVFSEIAKHMAHHDKQLHLSHYRDRNGYEVDFVLEDFAGTTVGLEVKATTGVSPRNFRGLHRLAEALGSRFACGIILHDGERTAKFGERMFAMPIRMLWEG